MSIIHNNYFKTNFIEKTIIITQESYKKCSRVHWFLLFYTRYTMLFYELVKFLPVTSIYQILWCYSHSRGNLMWNDIMNVKGKRRLGIYHILCLSLLLLMLNHVHWDIWTNSCTRQLHYTFHFKFSCISPYWFHLNFFYILIN